VTSAPRQLNNVTTVINSSTETLLAAVERCEQLMGITSARLTAFRVPV
jgi:hypothetical protein